MFQQLLSPALQEALYALPVNAPLCLVTNDTLLPWELLVVEEMPLALRHILSRQWLTTHQGRAGQWAVKPRLNCLLIADPTGELPAAEQEIEALIEVLDASPLLVRPEQLGVGLTQDGLLTRLASREYDLVHFAGHARPGALCLADGWLEAARIQQAIHGAPFIFLNACASAQASSPPTAALTLDEAGRTLPYAGQSINNLATAFLEGGASAFLGTLWPVADQAAQQLAVDFYRLALQGHSTGEALRRARTKHRQQPQIWAAATLYGDPLQQLFAVGPQQRTGSVLVVEQALGNVNAAGNAAPYEQATDQQRMAHWRNVVNRYGGRVAAMTPAQLVAIFGAEQLLEDDAERALLTALALLPAIAHEQANPVAMSVVSGPFTIAAHPADHGGPLTYYGESVTAALQLVRQARPGEILTNARTRRLAQSRFAFTPVENASSDVNSIGDDSSISPDTTYYRLLIGAETPVVATPLPMQLLERETALARLQEWWQLAEQGQGGVVAVVGEEGIGKSALVERFCLTHRKQPIRSLRLSAVSVNVDTPLSFLADFLRLLLAVTPRGDSATVRQQVIERIALFPPLLDRPGLLDLIIEILGVAPAPLNQEDRKRLRPELTRLVRRLLDAVSQTTPLLLLWEDAQYIDADSLELLTPLTERIDQQALLFLLVYRTGWQHPWHTIYTPIQLGRLRNARQLLQQLLTSEQLPKALEDAFNKLDSFAGNPRDIIDWVDYLQGGGILQQQDGLWQVTRPMQATDLAETLKRSQLALVAQLDQALQQTLRVAAVVDQGFTVLLLAEVLAETEDEMGDRLARLQSQQLICEDHQGVGYRFSKAKLRDVLYADLPLHQRTTFHRAIADALCDESPMPLFRLAHHYAESNDRASAVRYALLAAEQAATNWNNQGALEQYTRAAAKVNALLASAPTVLEEKRGATAAMIETWRRNSLEGCADIQSRIDQKTAAIQKYTTVLTMANNPPALSATRQADLWRKLAIAQQYIGQFTAAQQAIAQGFTLVADTSSVERGQLLLQRAMLHFGQGEHTQAFLVSQEAGEYLQESAPALAQARNLQCILACRLGRMAEAVAAGVESVALYRQINDWIGVARALSNLGIAYDEWGKWTEARRCYEESYTINTKTGDIRASTSAAIDLGEANRRLGELDQAMAMYQNAFAMAQQAEDRQSQAAILINQCMVALKREDFDQATDYLEESESLLAASGLHLYRPELWRLRAEVQLGRQQWQEADATARQALQWADEASDAIEIALAQRTVARVCAALGDHSAAEHFFSASLHTLRQQQRPYEVGLTLLAQATWLASAILPTAAGNTKEAARTCAEEALALFTQLGAQLDQQAIQAFLNDCNCAN